MVDYYAIIPDPKAFDRFFTPAKGFGSSSSCKFLKFEKRFFEIVSQNFKDSVLLSRNSRPLKVKDSSFDQR